MCTGSVYVFGITSDGMTWSLTQKLLAYDGKSYDYFGVSVSVFNNTIAVGADTDSSGMI